MKNCLKDAGFVALVCLYVGLTFITATAIGKWIAMAIEYITGSADFGVAIGFVAGFIAFGLIVLVPFALRDEL